MDCVPDFLEEIKKATVIELSFHHGLKFKLNVKFMEYDGRGNFKILSMYVLSGNKFVEIQKNEDYFVVPVDEFSKRTIGLERSVTIGVLETQACIYHFLRS